MKPLLNIFWFRRDLRLEDNTGLFHALNAGLPVQPVFIFDTDILSELEDPGDKRVGFIYHVILKLHKELVELGSTLHVVYGRPIDVFKNLIDHYNVQTVFTNHDYEPYASKRDASIQALVSDKGIGFQTYKDQVIFEKNEIVKPDGKYYSVFTPYARKWKSELKPESIRHYDTGKLFGQFFKQSPLEIPTPKTLGFECKVEPVEWIIDETIMKGYHSTRDIPSIAGTTKSGIHLRFGTISVRWLAGKAWKLNETFLNELIWREFFMQMLWHEPRLEHECFRREFESIQWRNNENEFARWCEGKTGYPIVDAGMRELNQTGFMHNRVRMITASFLVKHLLIDWKWGEAYFANKLLDYELAANLGNWQWVAGCGCDAAPYFRIFSPDAQTKRFDPKGIYIRKWLPEFETMNYPQPIVEHSFARDRCLKVFKSALAVGR